MGYAPMRSDVNPLDLVERDLLAQAVVELRGAGGLVPGDPGRNLEVTAVPQVLGDPASPRKLWAQISTGRPAWRARRLIILNAPTRDIPRSWSASQRPGSQLRKRSPRRSSPIREASR